MSYLEKWQDFNTHNDWSRRTESLSRFIPESTRSILELGSGKNHLRALKLIDLEKVSYQSSDITKADGIDLVINLNAAELPDISAEVIFFSGLIEYIYNVPRFFDWTRSGANLLLGTYAPVLSSPMNINESIRRSSNGWKNHMSLVDLHAQAYESGWSLEFKDRHEEQVLFVGHKA